MEPAEWNRRVVLVRGQSKSNRISSIRKQLEEMGFEVVTDEVQPESSGERVDQEKTGFNPADEAFKWFEDPFGFKPFWIRDKLELIREKLEEETGLNPSQVSEGTSKDVVDADPADEASKWFEDPFGFTPFSIRAQLELFREKLEEEFGLNPSQVSEGTSKDVVEAFRIHSGLHFSGAPQQEKIKTLLSRMGFKAIANALNENGFTDLDVLEKLLRDFNGTSIRDIFLKAGVLRTLQPSVNNVCTENPTSQTGGNVLQFLSKVLKMYLEMDGNRLEHDRGYVLVAVTLIATVSFQVGTNPPGGFWQDTTDTHVAGTSILASTKPHEYAVLKFWSTVGLVASLILTILILSGYPVTKKLFMGLLRFATVAMVFSMLMTYLTSVSIVLPSHDRELNRVNEIYKKTVFTLAGVCGIAILPPIICLLTWVLDKLPKIFKRWPVSLTKKNQASKIPISTASEIEIAIRTA